MSNFADDLEANIVRQLKLHREGSKTNTELSQIIRYSISQVLQQHDFYVRHTPSAPAEGSPADDKFVSPEPPPEGYDRELLTILTEECAEVAEAANVVLLSELNKVLARVQQRASKMLRFGVAEVQPGQPHSNADRLSDELGDLACLMLLVQERGLASRQRVGAALTLKRTKLTKFMQHSA
jgi:NTP pyrophosphatase (non-canonical NTP hydrolase)